MCKCCWSTVSSFVSYFFDIGTGNFDQICSWFRAREFPIILNSIKSILSSESFNSACKSISVSIFDSFWEKWWWESPSSDSSNDFKIWVLRFITNHCFDWICVWWINSDQIKWIFWSTVISSPIRWWLITRWTEEWKSIVNVGNFAYNWRKWWSIISVWRCSIFCPIGIIKSNNFSWWWGWTGGLTRWKTIIRSWSIFRTSSRITGIFCSWCCASCLTSRQCTICSIVRFRACSTSTFIFSSTSSAR